MGPDYKRNRMDMTAVEWLIEELKENSLLTFNEWKELFEQAKEMEKQQIIEAMDRMGNTDFYCEYESPEHYYKKTFKSE